jgi:uncharacterized protein
MSDRFYHEAQRGLQDSFGSRPLADRLEQRTRHDRFTEQDAAFIAAPSFFFLATADEQGRPDCSFKGGPLGFARVIAPDRLVFPDYDGNGMFRSLGNIQANPHVGLLFVALGAQPWRIRVNGTAQVFEDHPDLAATPGIEIAAVLADSRLRDRLTTKPFPHPCNALDASRYGCLGNGLLQHLAGFARLAHSVEGQRKPHE